jgi:uncharacterized protein (DUF2141 family)
MQSIRTFILVLFLFAGFVAKSQPPLELTIKFENLETSDGFIMLLIQDESANDVSKLVLPIQNNAAEKTIKLNAGKYGFSAYHDQNSNEKLDLNLFGAPTESYGFSNNARGTFSKPDFEETLVNVSGNQLITFKLE